MGGCRCSYRNCSLRTDGKTHMFHYPVFDKVRCHQWLTNAHKLEFLNLKVSQLKNRVVCQHHFRDEHFMNFKKAKLTFDAVPTEDGPYCDSDQLEEEKTEQYDTKAFGISLDDIENEYFDKKANFSVKYGDFLTNCDMMELDSLNQMASYNSQAEIKGHYEEPKANDILKDFHTGPVNNVSCITNNIVEPPNIILNDNINRKRTIMKVDPIVYDFDSRKNNLTQTEEALNSVNPNYIISLEPIEYEAKSENNHNVNVDQILSTNVIDKPKQCQTKEKSLLKKNIRIIHEKRISEPVKFVGKLERVSPNTVLPLPNRKKKLLNSQVQDNPEPSVNLTEAPNNLSDSFTNNIHHDKINVVPQTTTNVINKTNFEVLPKTSLLKNKIPPERVAAIAEKRKFNMKLRDIVEDCLDKLDEPEKLVYEKRKITQTPKKHCKEKEMRTYLSKEKDLPNINEYTIAYLEASMKKMENNLLNKIDQNSKKIIDLKQTFASSSCKKQNVYTQTSLTEDQHKKQLYHEISKYLSQKANSLIYEELFIDKYTPQFSKRSSSSKRSKYD